MANKIKLSVILNWLKSTEMFARPVKQIPGKWQLTEYYIEADSELRNITETQLKADNEIWNIEFTEEKKYAQQCNLPVSLISKIKDGNWNISKNYVTLTSFGNSGSNIEFQFAIEKKLLKLLKKDEKGRIEFFGFFRKLQ